jgi:hypothetical protein
MALIRPYNHTRILFNSGQCELSDDYLINLYSALPFNATATTKSLAEAGGTQLATANGYTADFKLLAGVEVVPFEGVGAAWRASNPAWAASGGAITAQYSAIFNASLPSSPPLFHIDLEGTLSAPDGQSLIIQWNQAGIYVTTVPGS